MKTRNQRRIWITAALFGVLLVAGTWMKPDFWSTPDWRGDRLMAKRKFAEAAGVYQDPWRKGAAQYRNGDFKDAATTFARVPGAVGAYDAGNALLMHGAYDAAIKSYDRALGFRPGWQEALDNKALAIARRDQMKISDEDRAEEATDAYDPDDIVADSKNNPDSDETDAPDEAGAGDQQMQATWLRQVKTTPGQFLRAKFASQDSAPPTPETP